MAEPPDIMHYTNNYILSTKGAGERRAAAYLRKEQVITLLGPHADLVEALPAAMVLTVPMATGPKRTSIYDWRDVHALLVEIGRETPEVK